jgi:hypothetical protein
MVFPESFGVQELIAQALEPIRDRPPRAFDAGRGRNFDGSIFSRRAMFDRGFLETRSFDRELAAEPMERMFRTETGRAAAAILGNETQTLDAIQTLSVDIMLAALSADYRHSDPGNSEKRTLFVPPREGLPPALLILDPELDRSETRRITDGLSVPFMALAAQWHSDALPSGEEKVRDLFMSDPGRLREALRIAQPEVVVARKPRMERLCVPSPFHEVRTQAERSTAGIYCRDPSGRVGITACYHGTGPAGTQVTVDGLPSTVAVANEVQDIVFIPLPDQLVPRIRAGIRGVLSDRTPSQYDFARFEGATSGPTETTISSHDAALLRRRPTVQLKVQTQANTEKGDSGSALIDRDGQVLGFAFEKSAYGEVPQITDWIWAANALAAIDVVPL